MGFWVSYLVMFSMQYIYQSIAQPHLILWNDVRWIVHLSVFRLSQKYTVCQLLNDTLEIVKGFYEMKTHIANELLAESRLLHKNQHKDLVQGKKVYEQSAHI